MDNLQFQKIAQVIQQSNAKDWFDYTIAISSLIVAVVAVIVGIRISNKFSLKNQILQKQLDTVYKLIEVLQDQRLTIGVKEPEGPKEAWLCETSFLDLLNIGKERQYLYQALSFNTPFYFTWDGYDHLEFMKYARNPYTPRSIASVICKFRYNGEQDWNNMVGKGDEQYRAILFPSRKDNRSRMELEDPWYVKDKLVHKDFATFVGLCRDLVDEIRKWLKEYEADEINFG